MHSLQHVVPVCATDRALTFLTAMLGINLACCHRHTLLVSDTQAAGRKVKGLPHCQLCLVLIHLADVGTGAGHLEGVNALTIVGHLATHLHVTYTHNRCVPLQ